jgi:hypothetical protein
MVTQLRSSVARSFLVLVALLSGAGGILAQDNSLSPQALAQIQALMDEKGSRTPAQQKIDSNLLYEARQRRGLPAAPGVPALQTGIAVGPSGEVVVDITATAVGSLPGAVANLGGKVLDSQSGYRSLRAVLPLDALETLAARPEVLFIQPKQEGMLNTAIQPRADSLRGVSASLLPTLRPGFSARAAAVRSQLSALLRAGSRTVAPLKTNTSEGVVTHRADLAMSTFGATGAGVNVGVLSDGVDALAALQASGDLPAGVTVLPGQAGSGNEGAAMLEIVFDMAPGANLFFATAFTSITSFAQNIKDLRTAGCDIIIDDVTYFVETPFQKGQTPAVLSTTNGGIVTQAVNDVTTAGALYFSSSANSGDKNKGTSGTWEGDFVDGGPTTTPPITFAGRFHDFDPGAGVATFDTFTAPGGPLALYWSDPLGGSANDYDLYFLTSGGVLFAASTNIQNGTQDPFEFIGVVGNLTNFRVSIVKFSGVGRFLHLDTSRSQLTFNTQGSTHGHNAPPNANSFGVAATPAVGPFPFPFNSSNTIETFSSDGPRQYFFNADSSAITPGDFSSTGGQIVQQPLVTAADGVSCAAPGFNPFFGTSAAAPHAGAIAALVKSEKPSLTAAQISSVLTSTAIDIEAAGVDRDSGFGILDAFNAVASVAPPHLFSLSPAKLWIGLRNSDDQGTQFDMLVEILKNGSLVARGLQRCITGLTRNPTFARETNTAFTLGSAVEFDPGDVLALRVSTRIGTNPDDTKCAGPGGSHNSAIGLRLYYDSASRASHFDATITPGPNENLYLHSDGTPCPNGDGDSKLVTTRTLDNIAPVAANPRCKDSGVVKFTGGNPFSVVGTWSLAPF